MAKVERKKGNTGKRYSEAERRRILAFVEKYGRGGITAASRQYGVSYIALRRWMKNGPEGLPRGGRAKTEIDGRRTRRIKSALAAVKAVRSQLSKVQASLRQLMK